MCAYDFIVDVIEQKTYPDGTKERKTGNRLYILLLSSDVHTIMVAFSIPSPEFKNAHTLISHCLGFIVRISTGFPDMVKSIRWLSKEQSEMSFVFTSGNTSRYV